MRDFKPSKIQQLDIQTISSSRQRVKLGTRNPASDGKGINIVHLLQSSRMTRRNRGVRRSQSPFRDVPHSGTFRVREVSKVWPMTRTWSRQHLRLVPGVSRTRPQAIASAAQRARVNAPFCWTRLQDADGMSSALIRRPAVSLPSARQPRGRSDHLSTCPPEWVSWPAAGPIHPAVTRTLVTVLFYTTSFYCPGVGRSGDGEDRSVTSVFRSSLSRFGRPLDS